MDDLEAYRRQPLTWTTRDDDPLEYADVEVPRDYADPLGPRLTVAVSRLRASGPAPRRGILLGVNGGPGGDWGRGRQLPLAYAGTPVHEVYDLIGFDPRGTGASTPLHAEVTAARAPFDSRPPDDAFAALAEDMRERELGCRRGGAELRPYISTRNTARDMDLIRAVLGAEKINFIGYAYGAYVAVVYGSMFPDRLDRCVLDSSVHPGWTWREQFLWQGDAVRRNVEAWAGWVSDRDLAFGLGTEPEHVLDAVELVAAAVADGADGRTLRTLFDGAVGNQATDRAQWADLARKVADLGRDPARARELLTGQSTWRPADNEGSLRIGVLEAITLEHAWPDDLEVYYADMREFRTRFPYGYGVLRAQPWVGAFRTFEPLEPPTRVVRDGYPAGLVVQADGDPMDHYDGGVAMAEHLGHRLVTVTDSGGHELYRLAGNAELDALVDRYLVHGELPPGPVDVPGHVARPEVAADPVRV